MRHATNVAIAAAGILAALVLNAVVAPVVSHTDTASTQTEELIPTKPDTSWLLGP
ncbi:MAG: hypothetical protein WBG10_17770 [Pseudolabrys sp.]|jgi:hypothetical protein